MAIGEETESQYDCWMAELDTHLFTANSPSDTIVVSFYPVGGNHLNSGPRYQAEAELTGYNVLGIVRPGSNTYTPNRKIKRMLSLSDFHRTCHSLAQELKTLTEGYRYVIVRGQSTGAYPSLGVVKSMEFRVTHLLVEDGLSTRPGRSSAVLARWDWFIFTLRERRRMTPPTSPLPATQRTSRSAAFFKFLVEQYHWGKLWRSDYGEQTFLDIARLQPHIPVLVIFFGNSAVSTSDGIAGLRASLESEVPTHSRAVVAIEVDSNAWHGFLLYPHYTAKHLEDVRALGVTSE